MRVTIGGERFECVVFILVDDSTRVRVRGMVMVMVTVMVRVSVKGVG